MELLVRLGVSAAAGVGAAFIAALVVTLIDLYLTGHGYISITREIITWESSGVHLSIGDIGMLVATVVIAALTWYLLGRGASK